MAQAVRLLSHCEARSQLWTCCWSPERLDASSLVQLGPQARQAWQAAAPAAERAAPRQWSCFVLEDPDHHLLWCEDHAIFHHPEVAAPPAGSVEGPSFGLGFAVLHLAALLELGVPQDVAFSASIEATGVLHSVGALPEKLAVAREGGIRRVVVAASEALDDPLLVKCNTLSEVVAQLWPDCARVIDAASCERASQRIARLIGFWRQPGTGSWLSPAAIRDTALHLQSLRTDDSYTYSLLTDIAAAAERHYTNNVVSLRLDPAEQLREHPQPKRSLDIADRIQGATDAGQPQQGLDWLATLNIPQGNDAFPAELTIWGAAARAHWVLLQGWEALDLAQSVVRGLLQRNERHEISRPLCVWLAVAAALGEDTHFDAALALLPEVAEKDRGWTELAAGVGALHLRRRDDALRWLASARSRHISSLVDWSAGRHLCALGALTPTEALANPAGQTGPVWSLQAALIALDSAVAHQDVQAARTALDQVEHAIAQPARAMREQIAEQHRVAVGQEPLEACALFARWYPY